MSEDPRTQDVVARLLAVLYLVYFQLTSQYARTVLGLLWFAITPAAFLAVYLPFLTQVFHVASPAGHGTLELPLLLLAGFLPWNAFAEGIAQGSSSLAHNPSIVKHAPTPPLILPLLKVVTAFAGLGLGLVVYLALAAATGNFPGSRVGLLPVAFALLFLFTLGASWLLSSVGAYLRDLLQAIPTLLLVGFFATPVGYAPSMISGRFLALVELNPLTWFVALFRASLSRGPFAWSDLGLAAAAAAVAFVAGLLAFRRLEEGFADVV